MKKAIIFGLIVIMSCLFGIVAYTQFVNPNDTNTEHKNLTQELEVLDLTEKNTDTMTQEQREQIVQKKIENIKKRLALKGLIVEGDSYFYSNQLPLALKTYLDFYRQNPSDPVIVQKIGDTYFEMKKFSGAMKYYEKIPNPNTSIKQKMILSNLYMSNLTNRNELQTFLKDLNDFSLTEDEVFYYTTSMGCVENFHLCKEQFQNHFWPEDEIIIVNEPGSNSGATIESYPPLQNIQQAIENYRNFQQDDVSLKNAYIIAEFFKAKLYPLAILLGNDLLVEKPNYKPIMKIVAESEYRLGNYSQAKDILSKYYAQDESDPDIAYMLAVINEIQREYLLANIYLQKALENNYPRPIDIYRRQAYNYSILGDEQNMLESLKQLASEGSADSQDLSLAIYYHILSEEYKQAEIWTQEGQNKFPDLGDFYAYDAWIQRENGNLDRSLETLKKGYEIDAKNPFLLLNLAYTEREKGNKGSAQVYLKQIVQKFPDTQFAIQAEKELDNF